MFFQTIDELIAKTMRLTKKTLTKTLFAGAIICCHTLCVGAHGCPSPLVQKINRDAVCEYAQTGNSALFVTLKNGNIHSFLLSEKPEITFVGSNFVISTTSTTLRYDRTEIEDFHFADSSVGIDDVKDNEMRIIRQNDNIQIYGLLSEYKPIRVYSINGILCETHIDITDDYANINLSNLTPNTYIIKLGNNKSIKIIKK